MLCTAVSVKGKRHYFGRNLDFTFDFGEKVVITPGNFEFVLKNGETIKEHDAIIGMAITENNYPLYFDGTNESGLSVAGLYFPGNAFYCEPLEGKINIASFELIPYILCKCKSVNEAEAIIESINITNEAFSEKYPPSPLHWMIADKDKCITLEATKKGIFVYDNKVGVLTNNPEFPYHIFNLNNFMSVSAKSADNKFSDKIKLEEYSKGLGALGLPGDNSSVSRFVRASFNKLNSLWEEDSKDIKQFFHILDSVKQIRGTVETKDGYEMTHYSSCCDTEKGIYYYKTYYNGNISAVSLRSEKLCSDVLTEYELENTENINYINQRGK